MKNDIVKEKELLNFANEVYPPNSAPMPDLLANAVENVADYLVQGKAISNNDPQMLLAANLVAIIAVDSLKQIRDGKLRSWQLSPQFKTLKANPTIANVFSETPKTRTNLKEVQVENLNLQSLNRAGLIFYHAMSAALRKETIVWGDIFNQIAPNSDNRMRSFLSNFKKSWADLPGRYDELCLQKSLIYTPEGLRLLAEGYTPNDALKILKTGKPPTPEMGDDAAAPTFAANPDMGSIGLQTLTKFVMKTQANNL